MPVFTLYSIRNSVSIRLSRRSSHDNSKAVNIGSRELKAIKELEDSARYALIRDWEWRRESVVLDVIHSSQPHLKFQLIYLGRVLSVWPINFLRRRPFRDDIFLLTLESLNLV